MASTYMPNWRRPTQPEDDAFLPQMFPQVPVEENYVHSILGFGVKTGGPNRGLTKKTTAGVVTGPSDFKSQKLNPQYKRPDPVPFPTEHPEIYEEKPTSQEVQAENGVRQQATDGQPENTAVEIQKAMFEELQRVKAETQSEAPMLVGFVDAAFPTRFMNGTTQSMTPIQALRTDNPEDRAKFLNPKTSSADQSLGGQTTSMQMGGGDTLLVSLGGDTLQPNGSQSANSAGDALLLRNALVAAQNANNVKDLYIESLEAEMLILREEVQSLRAYGIKQATSQDVSVSNSQAIEEETTRLKALIQNQDHDIERMRLQLLRLQSPSREILLAGAGGRGSTVVQAHGGPYSPGVSLPTEGLEQTLRQVNSRVRQLNPPDLTQNSAYLHATLEPSDRQL
mmetsp:Transcript_22672/g.35481  ORF Transcript_22672/g.35481 Transcript_22672/m.35481 type:complete len:395 (-) Transcript_22672:57-1241(-)